MKTILITGATSGIGRDAARHLSENGYRCVFVARNEAKMREMADMLSDDQIRHFYFKCDLSKLNTIKEIFEFLNQEKLILDGFIHCAGVAPLLRVAENDNEVMLKTFKINYFSFIEIAKYFLNPDYSNDGGSIIAISSIAAETGSCRQCIYGSSKAALNNSVKHIAKEALSRKIRVNAIMPGAVDTEMYRELCIESPTFKDKVKTLYPLGVIDPGSISRCIAYLLSDSARYITGTTITMDSGFLIH